MFNIQYKGYRPTSPVLMKRTDPVRIKKANSILKKAIADLPPVEKSPFSKLIDKYNPAPSTITQEVRDSLPKELREAVETLEKSSDDGFYVTKMKRHVLRSPDDEARIVGEYLALENLENQLENVASFIQRNGFLVHSEMSKSVSQPTEKIPVLKEPIETPQHVVPFFCKIYRAMSGGQNGEANRAAIAEKINKEFSRDTTHVEISDSGDQFDLTVITTSLMTYAIFAAVNLMQSHQPFVACQKCREYFQIAQSGPRATKYCSTKCRMAAHRAKGKALA